MPHTPRPLRRHLTAAVAVPLLLTACTGGSPTTAGPSSSAGAGTASSRASTTSAAPTTGTTASPSGPATTTAAPSAPAAPETTLLGGLDVPWSVVQLPDGSALVSVRNTGDVHRIPAAGSGGSPSVVGQLPVERGQGEGGLLGLAVPDDFDVNPVFYAYYSTESDNRIAAVPFESGRMGQPSVIFSGIPRARIHNGGRIAFGPDGYLYVATGEAGDRSLSQNLSSLGGKILRITPEGRAAPGNPFGGSPIWSYGHRNVQGLAWDSQKRLYASEFGANEWDELNLIQAGKNYGWPEVEGQGGNPEFEDPLRQWATGDLSPSGIAIGPDGAVYIAALRGESVWRVPLGADGSAGEPQRFLEGKYGRIRDVYFDGDRPWILTNNGGDDRLLSLPPADLGVQG